jgi:hypothetical protein
MKTTKTGYRISKTGKVINGKSFFERLVIKAEKKFDTENKEWKINTNKNSVSQQSIYWWNNLGVNPLLKIIKQGEFTTKYYGQIRKSSSLNDFEIEHIYVSEIFN